MQGGQVNARLQHRDLDISVQGMRQWRGEQVNPVAYAQ